MYLLEESNSATFHQQHLPILATEMYKVTKDLLPPLLHNIFKLRRGQTFNLRQNSQLFTPRVKLVYHGTGIFTFLGPKIWDQVPEELKSVRKP